MKLLSVRVQTVHNVTIINNKWKEPVFQKKKRNNEKSNNKKMKKVLMFSTAVVSLQKVIRSYHASWYFVAETSVM